MRLFSRAWQSCSLRSTNSAAKARKRLCSAICSRVRSTAAAGIERVTPLDLEGQRPIGAVAGRAFGFAAATRLAALLEAASQRAGAQVAEGGEFLLDPHAGG